ncbi:MAG: DNA replication and repair protein RecF, partial [Deltaproteobacteria bacterium]|nr:DNA replication and repair protein RecF [Deltaproteobacteria bacterium]
AVDNILIKANADVYRLEGSINTAVGELSLAVAYQRGGRRKISIDSAPVKARELYERFSVVSSGPEDSDILSGPPSTRRLFIDIYLSQLSQSYLTALGDYQKALTQKNAALKKDMDPSPFDPLLCDYGSRIILARKLFLEELAPIATGHYSNIAAGEELRIKYKPKVSCENPEADIHDIEEAFRIALETNAERERVLKTAMVGPHRDEVKFTIGEFPARTHGSQGQWRTAAVSLKLAVYEMLKNKRSSQPILLLDEIFAELDKSRAQHLMELFSGVNQLFLTTAGEPPVTIENHVRRFRIANGNIEGID